MPLPQVSPRAASAGRVVCETLRGMRSPHPCFIENRALLRLKLSVPHISRWKGSAPHDLQPGGYDSEPHIDVIL